MTNNKTSSFPTVEFEPSVGSDIGIELLTLNALYEKSSNIETSPFAPHRVQFHHLIFVTEGIGSHLIDFNHHPVRNGSVVFVNKGQVHAFDAENRPRGSMLLFTQKFVDSIRVNVDLTVFRTGYNSDTHTPVISIEGELRRTCEILLDMIGGQDVQIAEDRLVVSLLFTSLMVKLLGRRRIAGEVRIGESEHRRLARFLSLVQDHFTTTKDATSYADMLGMSYKTLNHLCKHTMKKTPKQVINAHTILEAKRRLAIDDIQVSQLAYELGFDDVSNFTKYFKKHTLVSPSDFRRRAGG